MEVRPYDANHRYMRLHAECLKVLKVIMDKTTQVQMGQLVVTMKDQDKLL